MPTLRGSRALRIDDCRKYRKNQGKPQKHPRRMDICWTLNKTQVLLEFWRIIMYIKENSPVKDSNMNYQEQKYYQQGKIDGIREFVRELKKHSCSYDLEEWMNFDAVNVEVIDTLMNDCINKILAEITASEE